MNNLIIYMHCLLIDIDDVQVQINTIINQILFELTTNDFRPTYSINYSKDGLVITFNDLENLTGSCDLIINNLSDNGWLGSIVKIVLNDFISDRSVLLMPSSRSSKDDEDQIADIEVPIINQPYSNSINFN